MGCKTRFAGRVINEPCDECGHMLAMHADRYPEPPGPDGRACLACDWESRIARLEDRTNFGGSVEDER